MHKKQSRSDAWTISSLLKLNSITLAGSKLVTDRFEAKFHYAIWFEDGRRPDSVMEFGCEPASSC